MSRAGGIILSFIGGLVSIVLFGILIMVIFPEWIIFGTTFLTIFRVIMVIGGIITIIGAFFSLFANTPDSVRTVWKIILIGGIVGGGNILAILGAMQLKWYMKDIS